MASRRLLMSGLIASALLLGAMAAFLALWRLVPQWDIGGWSFRANWWLTSEASCEELLRSYHRSLDKGYSITINEWLDSELERGQSSTLVRMAILRFFALRAENGRQPDAFCKRGPDLIGEVLVASRAMGADKRGAVMLMECLRKRQVLKLYWVQDVPAGAEHFGDQLMHEIAWDAFQHWWELSQLERMGRDPLDETGILLASF